MLYQNDPNPFNPGTTLRFDAPKTAHVQIVIYDMLARRVRTLVDGEFQAGTHQILWDGRKKTGARVVSGAYFVSILKRRVGVIPAFEPESVSGCRRIFRFRVKARNDSFRMDTIS